MINGLVVATWSSSPLKETGHKCLIVLLCPPNSHECMEWRNKSPLRWPVLVWDNGHACSYVNKACPGDRFSQAGNIPSDLNLTQANPLGPCEVIFISGVIINHGQQEILSKNYSLGDKTRRLGHHAVIFWLEVTVNCNGPGWMVRGQQI